MTPLWGMRDHHALLQLFTAQHGVASRRQLRDLGIDGQSLRALRRAGTIDDLTDSIVVATASAPTYRRAAMAAALRAGVAAMSHGTAARLHRLAGFADYDRFDVIGGKGSHLVLDPPVITHYTRGPLVDEIVHVGPIPTTSIPLTLALLAPVAGIGRTVVALTDALRRGISPATITATARAWRGHGRPGPATLLDLLDGLREGSLLEHRPRRRPRIAATGHDVGDQRVPAFPTASLLRS